MAQVWYDTGSFKGVIDANPLFWSPPLLFYLMKTLMHFGLSAEIAGVCLSIAFGTFTPLLTYGIAYEITQRKDISICSALLTAVNPAMNSLAIEVQRDMGYLFFIGIALWLLSAGIRRHKKRFWVYAGIVCGCSMLFRYETLEFLVIVPLILLVLYVTKKSLRRNALCCGGLFLTSFFGVIISMSFIMQTQDYLFPSYRQYFQQKADMSNLYYPGLFEEPGK